MVTLTILAFIPSLILAVYIYLRDGKDDREPIGLLVKTFVYGIFSALAVLMEHSLFGMLHINLDVNTFTTAFISAALLEELTKFIFLYLLIWRNDEFNERFDGIVYAAFVGLGFAFFENILYLGAAENAFELAYGRGMFATPAHFFFAVAMGYGFGLAKFGDPSRRRFHIASGVVCAIVLHGIYDYLLIWAQGVTDPTTAGSIMCLFYLFDIILWHIGLKRIKKLRNKQ